MIDRDRWWGMWAQSSGDGDGGRREGGRGRRGGHGHDHGGREHGHGRGHGGRGRRGHDHGGFEGHGRRGRDGGRVFGPGDLRIALLALIAEQPRHGYELIKEIEQRFGGTYAPSPGSVYPTLTLMEELGYIAAAESEGGKRLYSVTGEGRGFLEESRTAVDGVMTRMALAARAMAGGSVPDAVVEAMHTLRAAIRFHSAGWSEAETERVRGILERAADDIGGESR